MKLSPPEPAHEGLNGVRRLGAGLVFLKLECDVDVVVFPLPWSRVDAHHLARSMSTRVTRNVSTARQVKGAIARVATYMSLSDNTVEDWWNGPSMFPGVCFRDKYGEYSYEHCTSPPGGV